MAFPQPRLPTTTEDATTTQQDDDIQEPILQKLPIFKNMVANRDRKKPEDINLVSKPQIHPLHDIIHHPERKIEKKDQAKLPDPKTSVGNDFITTYRSLNSNGANKGNLMNAKLVNNPIKLFNNDLNAVPEFKPTLPDVFLHENDIKLSDGYIAGLKQDNYDEYYDDDNLYDDYIQSNSMTSYLIEKVQELHDWIVADPDFDAKALERKNSGNSTNNNEFGQLLKALNESLMEGNVTIVMNKLRELYFVENFTNVNQSRKVILSNSTNLLSFGILTLDVMLLHNIQLMAWESQVSKTLALFWNFPLVQ